MKKAILFDIDGTLLDAWDFIFDSVKNSIAVHIIKPFAKTKQTLKKIKDRGFLIAAVSNRIRKSVRHSLKVAKIKTVGVTYGFLGKDIAKHNPDYLIDDISELLQILK